jgi:DNA-binding transcriptional MerR regulator
MTVRKSDTAYRTISEAAEEAGLPAHVLRFWETKFPALRPLKQRGGRRLYRPQDVALVKGLKRLLHENGLTIKGAQKYLKDNGVAAVAALADAAPMAPSHGAADGGDLFSPSAAGAGADTARLRQALARLEDAKARLDRALSGRSAA